ncbi:MAG: LysR family transcriptional regulator [Candidatus Brocadiales bacterium]
MPGKISPGFKVWLEKEGEVVFAEGRKLLLEAVDELGSLNAAAKKLGMSYRAAWGKIKATEKRLGVKLLESNVGGRGGGGARLTRDAREILRRYNRYKTRIKASVERECKAIFKK